MPTRLHIFDLDDTLLDGPDKEDASVVAAAREAIADPDVSARVLSARDDIPPMRANAEKRLKEAKLTFEVVELKHEAHVSAPKHKADVVREWIAEMPDLQEVSFWDDLPENEAAVEAVVREAGLEYDAPMSKPKSMSDMRKKASKKALKKGKTVKDARGRDRNYRKEYDRDHSSPEAIEKRSMRNKARVKLGLKVGDGKEVDHKTPVANGGTNAKGNLRVTTRKKNRSRPLPKRKK